MLHVGIALYTWRSQGQRREVPTAAAPEVSLIYC
jgi:hypothetical protein